ncbi:uncharacterized protein [Drosophila virilis]|uniref:Uncharacterized protein n=1 Tax=Drosophila virilis TaxID=7244 RepID=B4M025_DROVI|nr:uncharacterized protein LOC6629793 [Drosophila virilis]XP_032295044.1 uncharacterized protein LOC6629793 [Drosophila virilis]XP_032295045.1 uncharacterized protein LOC6629793 [Drosophila virilis]EDW68275.1 uncharacterized protein Dvir_GJ24625 [Drosophila virilis]
MRLLIWLCSLCFVGNNVGGMFLELPGNTAATSADDGTIDDFLGGAISGLNRYLGGKADATRLKPVSQRKGSTSPETSTATIRPSSSGFLDEMETSLEHATDTLDGLWQQFRQGLLNLVDSFSVADNDGSIDIDQGSTTPASSVQQLGTTTPTVVPTTKIPTAITTLGPATVLEITSSTPLP